MTGGERAAAEVDPDVDVGFKCRVGEGGFVLLSVIFIASLLMGKVATGEACTVEFPEEKVSKTDANFAYKKIKLDTVKSIKNSTKLL